MLRMTGQARIVDTLDGGCASSQRASSKALALCFSMRSDKVSRPDNNTQALNGASVGPAVRTCR
jgi:hypothetical protein